MKLLWNNKLFPSLNIIIGGESPHRIKVVLRHYHYRSDTSFFPGIFAHRLILCSCNASTIQLCLPWDIKIKYGCNKPRYGRVDY